MAALKELKAANSVCQGSGADLIKKAMIMIHNKLNEMNSATVLLLQVHDELIYEIPQSELTDVLVRWRIMWVTNWGCNTEKVSW